MMCPRGSVLLIDVPTMKSSLESHEELNRVKVCLPFIIIFILFYITFGDFVFHQLESPKMVLQSLSVFESVL